MKFNEKLQSLRKASGLSQEELADKLGVSRQAVSKWESASSYPEMDKLVMMTKIFNCSMDDLVNDKLTDQNIMEKKNKLNYLDSFLEFVTKTINMFGNMKFTSGIKCLIEMCIVGLILYIMGEIVLNILDNFTVSLFSFLPSNALDITSNVIGAIFKIFLFIVGLIVMIQTFKSRYLDYYDKAVYEYKQKEENGTEKKENKKEEVKEEKIIIRDPDHRPFEFLSGLSKIVIIFIKIMVFLFGLFFIGSFIFFVSGAVLSLFVSFDTMIAFGIFLGFLSAAVINYEVLEIMYCFIFDKKCNLKRLFIIFIASLVVCGVGISVTFYQFKNINYTNKCEDVIKYTDLKKTYDMNDNLYIADHRYADTINYVVDNSVDNVIVNAKYDERFVGVRFDEYNNAVNVETYDIFNFSNFYGTIVKDLKNMTIRDCDSYDFSKVIVTANEANIKKLISNASKEYEISYSKVDNGYSVYYENRIYNDMDEYDCVIDSNGINVCNEIDD